MKNFDWPVRVYYEDTDAGGVVYYANYLKFYERARTEMLRDMGFEQDHLRSTEAILFAVRSANIDYLKPAFFNDNLQVDTRISRVKPASLVFEQRIVRDNELLNTGEIRIACINADTLRPKFIPQVLLDQLKI